MSTDEHQLKKREEQRGQRRTLKKDQLKQKEQISKGALLSAMKGKGWTEDFCGHSLRPGSKPLSM